MLCFQCYVAVTEFEDENYDDDNLELPSLEMIDDDYGSAKKSKSDAKRGRMNFITDRLLAALDKAKVSSRMAVHLLFAAAEAFGYRLEKYALNHKTIHLMRREHRLRQSEQIAKDFTDNVIFKCQIIANS